MEQNKVRSSICIMAVMALLAAPQLFAMEATQEEETISQQLKRSLNQQLETICTLNQENLKLATELKTKNERVLQLANELQCAQTIISSMKANFDRSSSAPSESLSKTIFQIEREEKLEKELKNLQKSEEFFKLATISSPFIWVQATNLWKKHDVSGKCNARVSSWRAWISAKCPKKPVITANLWKKYDMSGKCNACVSSWRAWIGAKWSKKSFAAAAVEPELPLVKGKVA